MFYLIIWVCQIFLNPKIHFRYADDVSIGNEVLVRENGQLKEVQVKDIANFLVQGNNLSNILFEKGEHL